MLNLYRYRHLYRYIRLVSDGVLFMQDSYTKLENPWKSLSLLWSAWKSLNCSCFSGYFLKLFGIKNWTFCWFRSYLSKTRAVWNSLKLPFEQYNVSFYGLPQGCKLLSDIGQSPTKFGTCPSKSNFDRTLVRSKKYIVTLYIFFAVTKSGCKFTQFAFAIKFTLNEFELNLFVKTWIAKLIKILKYSS
jgi:hypothetical protein